MAGASEIAAIASAASSGFLGMADFGFDMILDSAYCDILMIMLASLWRWTDDVPVIT